MPSMRHGKQTVLVLALLVIGLALFNSAKWVMLSNASEVSFGVTLVSRIVGIATFATTAFLFYNKLPSVRRMVSIIAPFTGLYVLTTIAAYFIKSNFLGNVILYANAVFYGIAASLVLLLGAHAFSCYRPKMSVLLFAVLQLLTDSMMMVFASVPVESVFWVRITCLVLGFILLLFGIRLLLSGKGSPDHPLQFESGESVSSSKRKSSVYPVTRADWALLLTAGFLFSSVFGIMAQISSTSGGSFALFDVNTSAVVLAVEVLLIMLLVFIGDRYDFSITLLIVVALMASGFALYSHSWENDTPLAGALLRSGFDCNSILIWGLVARKAYDNPVKTYLYFGLYRSLSTVDPGRALGQAILGANVAQGDLISIVSLTSLWLICLFGVFAYALSTKRRGVWVAPAFEDDDEPLEIPMQGDAAPGLESLSRLELDSVEYAQKIAAFGRRLKLSPREQDVLMGLMHGQTRNIIAEKLFLSPDTVKDYTGRIYTKAEVHSKKELMALVEAEPIPEE